MGDLLTTRTGGITLAYRESGDPAAPPLVLLPGLGLDSSDWDGVAPALAARHRVLALDPRGHGASEWPGAYSLPLLRDDLHGFLDALGLARVTLVGHSMGGATAHLFAQAHPGRVERLVLEDVPAPRPREPRTPVRPEGPLPFDWAAVTALVKEIDEPDPAWLAGLPRITAPTLLVAGGPGSHVPQEGIAEMSRLIPDCRMVTIEAGHEVHAARPAEFLDAVLPFLTCGP
ncbi:alpha/beta hydrolase [Streptomyces capparidis]